MVILFGLARRTARKSRKHHYFTSSARFAEGRRLPILVLRAMATVPVLLRDARREVVGVAAAASGSVRELDLCPAQRLHAAPYGPSIRAGLALPRPVARQHRAPVHRALWQLPSNLRHIGRAALAQVWICAALKGRVERFGDRLGRSAILDRPLRCERICAHTAERDHSDKARQVRR